MKKIVLLFVVFAFSISAFAQNPAKYWVAFKDKANSPYSIERPEEFLSPRAIEKRHRFNIAITEEDLPVNENYIQQLLAIDSNMVLFTKSKWLNGVTVYSTTTDIQQKINQLQFVDYSECTATMDIEETFDYPHNTYAPPKEVKEVIPPLSRGKIYEYGYGSSQISRNMTHWLHHLGAHGEGMLMVIMDVGFENVNKLSQFEALRNEGRLLGTRNFVFPGRSVFIKGSHGTEVLSCIAAYDAGNFVGTAPKASFYLAKTEDSRSENKIEEDNWVAAIEWADSLGCDVINSSLGYYKFDNDKLSYQYEEMTGKISRASQAAAMASSKGIVVCVSAGNEGDGKWHYITAPADAENIITVGAIDIDGSMASFSSYGPTADGRIKPDALAVGSRVFVITPAGKLERSYGTSFSSPVLAGMVACLWQLCPDKTADQIIDAVRHAGTYYHEPGDQYGYGITNFVEAYNYLLRPNAPTLTAVFPASCNKSSCVGEYLALANSTFTIEIRLNDEPTPILTQVVNVTKNLAVYQESYWYNKLKIKLPKLPKGEDSGIAHLKIISSDGSSYEQVMGLYK